MAFTQLARLQMLNPLGGILGELQQLEDILAEVGVGAILDTATQSGQVLGAIMDEGGTGGQGELTNGEALPSPDPGNDNVSDDMSEPTELERAARQLQLDADSKEFNDAVGSGVFDEQGQELYTDSTWRPAARPPPPPIPGKVQYFELASGNSSPSPELVESSPDTTPKRQRTKENAASAPDAIAANLPAAPDNDVPDVDAILWHKLLKCSSLLELTEAALQTQISEHPRAVCPLCKRS